MMEAPEVEQKLYDSPPQASSRKESACACRSSKENPTGGR